MNELYNILSIFLSSGLLLAFGLMLLFSAVGDSPLLANYRKARWMMAAAYLFFACVNLAEYFMAGTSPSVSDAPLLRTVTLAIAASQALLFTFAMLSLLEVRFPGWGSIFREAAPALVLIAAVFAVYAACSETFFDVAFWVFAGLYALLLVRYTYLFVGAYRRFRRRMDDFFSEPEADRMRWIAVSFFAALAIGIGALLTTVFVSTVAALVFTVVFDVFYTFFAIRFINYATRFHTIEPALEVPEPATPLPAAQKPGEVRALSPQVCEGIEARLGEWRGRKLFLVAGVTLEDVSRAIGTNNKYLSLYLNQHVGSSFREWIGALRIDEARRLMRERHDLTITEIASLSGFATKSHFGQQFRSLTGASPSEWRRRNAPAR